MKWLSATGNKTKEMPTVPCDEDKKALIRAPAGPCICREANTERQKAAGVYEGAAPPVWKCPERESNPHIFKGYWILSPARLPIPPSGLMWTANLRIFAKLPNFFSGGMPSGGKY